MIRKQRILRLMPTMVDFVKSSSSRKAHVRWQLQCSIWKSWNDSSVVVLFDFGLLHRRLHARRPCGTWQSSRMPSWHSKGGLPCVHSVVKIQLGRFNAFALKHSSCDTFSEAELVGDYRLWLWISSGDLHVRHGRTQGLEARINEIAWLCATFRDSM